MEKYLNSKMTANEIDKKCRLESCLFIFTDDNISNDRINELLNIESVSKCWKAVCVKKCSNCGHYGSNSMLAKDFYNWDTNYWVPHKRKEGNRPVSWNDCSLHPIGMAHDGYCNDWCPEDIDFDGIYIFLDEKRDSEFSRSIKEEGV